MSNEEFEAFLISEAAQIVSAQYRGEDKHVAELSMRVSVKALRFNQCVISKTHA